MEPKLKTKLNTAARYFMNLINGVARWMDVDFGAVIEYLAILVLDREPTPVIDDVDWNFRHWPWTD